MFGEIMLDRELFNSGWHATGKCGWKLKGCQKYANVKHYQTKGNLCSNCSSIINNIVKEQNEKRMQNNIMQRKTQQ